MTALLAVLSLAGLAACAAETPEHEISLDDYLVATIDLGPGHTLEVFEPTPGDLMYEETAAPGVELTKIDLSTIEPMARLYARLRPGQPVPREIEELAARERALVLSQDLPTEMATFEHDESAVLSASAGARDAPHNNLQFDVNECRDEGETELGSGVQTVDWAVCFLEEEDATSWAWARGLHAAQSVVYSYRGTVRQKVSMDDGGGWLIVRDRNVHEGEQKQFWRVWRTNVFGFKSEVLDANNNGYHHAIFGSRSTSETVRECYLEGYHCGLGVVIKQ